MPSLSRQLQVQVASLERELGVGGRDACHGSGLLKLVSSKNRVLRQSHQNKSAHDNIERLGRYLDQLKNLF